MYVIGMMSGTSADGIDVALCQIADTADGIDVRLIAAKTFDFDADLRERILRCCDVTTSRVDELTVLHFELAERHAAVINALLKETDLGLEDVGLVGVHGQTVWHNVMTNGKVNATLQITEASVIAARTGITIISNFRSRDVAAGGQGAPLTAYVDWLLLRHPTQWRAVQNIGGMGNVTLLPPRSETGSRPVAFDTGPGNALIDGSMEVISQGRLHYDADGQIAAQGVVNEDWLSELFEHPYYRRQPPKTTGREVFGKALAEELVLIGRKRGLSDANIVATLTMLTAVSIVEAYRMFLKPLPSEIIIGGGGGRNKTLMAMLQNLLPSARILSHEDIGLSSDFKEAVVFAILAYETWHARPGTLAELTGANHAAILGQITPGENFCTLIQSTIYK